MYEDVPVVQNLSLQSRNTFFELVSKINITQRCTGTDRPPTLRAKAVGLINLV